MYPMQELEQVHMPWGDIDVRSILARSGNMSYVVLQTPINRSPIQQKVERVYSARGRVAGYY